MKRILMLAAPAMLVSSNAFGMQTPPASHEQHQATDQHQAKPAEESCCCEKMLEEMHKMMSDMMRMHQGMAAHSSHDQSKNQPQQKQ